MIFPGGEEKWGLKEEKLGSVGGYNTVGLPIGHAVRGLCRYACMIIL